MKTSAQNDCNEAGLVKKLPGVTNEYATVNGVKLHYVTGGSGKPLVLPAGLKPGGHIIK
jgi:hypothetical protein